MSNNVQEGSRRLKKVPTGSWSSRMFNKVQEGSRRFKKVQKGSRRFKKVQEGSIRFKKVQEGSRRFNKAQGSKDTKGFKNVQETPNRYDPHWGGPAGQKLLLTQ